MSKEICMFERVGGTYTEVDGILYPNMGIDVRELTEVLDVENADVGKYGHLWISYMKENHKDRYRHHVRMGQLYSRANDGIPELPPKGLPVNELDTIQQEIFQYCNQIVPRYIP